MSAYKELEKIFEQTDIIGNAAAILHWDTDVMMPEGAGESRGESLAALSAICHNMIIDKKNGDLLDKAEQDNTLDEWQRANLREMRSSYDDSIIIPTEMVERYTILTNECELLWRTARKENNFKMLLPKMQEVLNLSIEWANIKAEKYNVSTYEALLDDYEPSMTIERLDTLFDDLAEFLPDFTNQVLEKQKSRNILPLTGNFDINSQKQLGIKFMNAFGFDFNRGRLDVSIHPFCGGNAHDVRITTKYNLNDYSRSLLGVIHETGHALYEQGRPQDWIKQPVSESRSYGIHESQSLFWEMQVARSKEFTEYSLPIICEAFNVSGPAWTLDNLYYNNTEVKRGLIRIDADEVTYPAHVILRYRLERDLISGNMNLKDLPEAWRAGMKELIGIEPETDSDGCMQDIHWPSGAWGYFPSYTLGAMNAAQLFVALKAQIPTVHEDIRNGNFAEILQWLRDNIHSKASFYSIDELMTNATGSVLTTEAFKNHLRNRYLND